MLSKEYNNYIGKSIKYCKTVHYKPERGTKRGLTTFQSHAYLIMLENLSVYSTHTTVTIE